MDKIILIGGGGHCKSVIDVIENTGCYEIFGIIDTRENIGKQVLSYKIIGTDEDLADLRKEVDYAFISIGQIYTSQKRREIYSMLKQLNYRLPVLVSPRAYVSKHSKIGEGTLVMHGAIVNAGAVIGKNCIINTMALIEHDAIIGDFLSYCYRHYNKRRGTNWK